MLRKTSLLSDGNSSIGFFGLGRSNLAILRELSGLGVDITLRSDKKIDRGIIPRDVKIKAIYEGCAAFENLTEKTLVLSPSVRRERPELVLAKERGVRLTSDAELFFEAVDAPVYAISGSDGKSTTAALTHLLLGASPCGTALCGNVGKPMLPMLKCGYSRYVTELSSFMLRYFSPVLERAALTNVTPNHLDWHEDFKEYRDAKLAIYKAAKEAVVNLDDNNIIRGFSAPVFAAVSTEVDFATARPRVRAEVYYTLEDGYIKRSGEPYIKLEKIKRRELHNLKNFMTALALTDGKRLADENEVARDFGGLSHRCELVTSWHGITFINSSIDTSPARCATTLAAQMAPTVVILGGRGKGVPFDPIREPLKRLGRCAVLLGECAEEIKSALPNGLPTRRAYSMDEAVAFAASLAKCGDTVLLSPAATSYDSYNSFEERGEDFKLAVKKYCEKHS